MRKLRVGSTNSRSDRACQAKRVAPPTVPDCGPSRHSGSSFASSTSVSAESSSGGYGSISSGWSGSGSASDQQSSLGFDEALPAPPPSPEYAPFQKQMYREGELIYGSRGLPLPNQSSIFTFPAYQNQVYGHILNRSGSQPSAPHARMDYSTTLLPHPGYIQQASPVDQGIELIQSPGRESPSSSTGSSSTGLKSSTSSSSAVAGMIFPGGSHSTTSTTSLDSGRASSYEHAHRSVGGSSFCSSASMTTGASLHQHLMSAGSQDSCLRHRYHSSSSSLWSSSKSDDIHTLDVRDMVAQGVPEHEVLNAWLTDLGFEEYYDLFVKAGYDMHTIIRMTPEDLTAIGIQKPNHREKLKAELAQLNIPDGLPEFIPDTLEEWLALLGLVEYSPSLRRQGYRTVEDATQLTWEDLEDFGILRLGHQKKILLAIKRVKDILSGKWVSPPAVDACCYSAGEISCAEVHSGTLQYRASHYVVPPPISTLRMPQQQLLYQYRQPLYQPDVVAVQVHRNKSTEDLRPFEAAGVSAATNPTLPNVPQFQNQGGQTFYKAQWRQGSFEEGDISPVNELALQQQQQQQQMLHQCVAAGGGTLPLPRGEVKPRPVAEVCAKTHAGEEDVYKPFTSSQNQNFSHSVSKQQQQQQQLTYGSLTRKAPPLPPKRSVSSKDEVYSQLSKGSTLTPPPQLPPPPPADSLSLLSYSEDSEDFPPPPAPITASDSYLQQGQAAAAASVRERLDNILQCNGVAYWPRPHGHLAAASQMNASRPLMPNTKNMARDHECSPCESIDTSDTEVGSPKAEFRQGRSGSDASFKLASSTESESLPFGNDIAGMIKQKSVRPHPGIASLAYMLSPAQVRRNATKTNQEASDVLDDIGNMLAGLTEELDAMIEEETKHKS